MKELSIEEKARRYDEAIKRAKNHYSTTDSSADIKLIGLIFPELKWSEDKKMIQYFKDLAPFDKADELYEKYGFSHKDAIAWLEKQGGHAKFINGIQVGDKVTRNEDGVLVNLSQLKRIAKPAEKQCNNMGISEATKKKLEDNLNKTLEEESPKSWNEFLNEQGEQKPIESMSEFKEGDILYNKDSYASDSIFIFKGMSDKTNAYLCYARLYDKKDFSVYSKEDWDEGVGIYGGEFYPANHKQKELLFSEIEKAGYKWNPDEKKMEKIEQKHIHKHKVGDTIYYNSFGELKSMIVANVVIDNTDNPMYEDYNGGAVFEKDLIEPKPTWSEEDEAMRKTTILYLENTKDSCAAACVPYIVKCINWLKSLNNRYTWKPSDEHYELEEFAKIVRGNLTGISKAVQELFEAKYLQLTGEKMYGGFKD